MVVSKREKKKITWVKQNMKYKTTHEIIHTHSHMEIQHKKYTIHISQ